MLKCAEATGKSKDLGKESDISRNVTISHVNPGDFQDRRSNVLRDAIRYGWWIVASCVVLGAIVGGLLTTVRPATYSSTTTVFLNQTRGNPYTTDSNSDTLEMLQTEAVSVLSQTTANEVIDELSLATTPEQLRRDASIIVPANTQTLEIQYSSTERSEADDIVRVIAERYLAQRELLADGSVEREADALQEQIDVDRELLDEAVKQDTASLAEGYRADILQLQAQLAATRALSTDPGRVLLPASSPQGSPARQLVLYILGGGLAGALVGGAIALGRERRRDLIRSAADLSDYDLNVPVTTVPTERLDEESMREIRMRLAPRLYEHSIVALIGTTAGQALPAGALLAKSLAHSGTAVALIDGTGTEPGHRDVFQFDERPGLAEALHAGDNEATVITQVSDRFVYLPAGRDAADAADLLLDDRARRVVQGIAESNEVTLLACRSLDNPEGEALAGLADGLLVLVQINRTAHFDLGATLRTIARQRRTLLGVLASPATQQ